jgi:hypothetical protein
MPLIIGRFFGRFSDSISSSRNYQKALDAARRSPLKADGLRGDGGLRDHSKIYLNRSAAGSALPLAGEAPSLIVKETF